MIAFILLSVGSRRRAFLREKMKHEETAMLLGRKKNSPRKWTRTPAWALLGLAAVGLALAVWSLSNIGTRTRHAAAVQNAMMLTESVRAFRTLYSSRVIARLEGHGIRATHQETDTGPALPLPKALSLQLADAIGKSDLESTTRLYSPYPFPWNPEQSLQDDFARRAWIELSADPNTPVQTFEEREGRTFLRYATSDVMNESCTQCHNTYPGTPRNNWKSGDLRGVLEISLPVDSQVAQGGAWLSRGIGVFSFLGLLFVGVAGLSVVMSRLASQAALKQAERHRRTNEELQEAIIERELAETETRQLESQIQQAQKLESFNLMVGGLAHDFNNLLLPIVANTDILRERVDGDSMNLEMITEVELAANRAVDLCTQMLNYTGKSGSNERVGVNLSDLLEETTRLLTANLDPKNQLHFDLADNLPLIEADKVQISQVVLNLIKNADEAMGDQGGNIRLRTGREEIRRCSTACEYCDNLPGDDPNSPKSVYCRRAIPRPGVFLEVSDDGMGMDAATKNKIFDPFFSTKFTGRGLGLAAVQGIVRSHGGTIRVDSEPGSHTLIHIVFLESGIALPADESAPERAFAEGEASGTILLAEDEPSVQAVARRMIEGLGFGVVTASDGEDALWRFSREPERFVALVSDITMPKMDGLKALEAIRKVRPGFPAILCSGYSERIDELTAIEDAKTLFLRKPFRSITLQEKLYALIAEASAPSPTDEDSPTHAPVPPPRAGQNRSAGWRASIPAGH